MNTSMGKSPFESGRSVKSSSYFDDAPKDLRCADEYVHDLQASFQKIKDTIQESQQRQKRATDKHRRFLAFKEDDWVLLKFPKPAIPWEKIGKECTQVIKSTMLSLHAVTMVPLKFRNASTKWLIG